ncbi:MAG: aminopeptidase P family protein [Thermodesulfobacteriota bacterium]
MQTSPLPARLSALREILVAHDLEALLVTGPENRRYLSGFTAREELLNESCGMLLISRASAWLLTDFRYQEWARQEAPDFQVEIYQGSPAASLAALLLPQNIRRLGFEAPYFTYRQYQRFLQESAESGWNIDWLPQEGLVEKLREVKTPGEVAAMRRALTLTEGVFLEVAGMLAPGLTERQVAWEIEKRLRRAEAEGPAFNPIVAAGPNSARPHHRPGDYPLKAGEPIIIDLGGRQEGYCADMTRTLIIGPPGDRFREIYSLVRQAQRRAEEGIRAGMSSLEADALAREVISQAGYGENFGHSLGHGVGLAVHEAPNLSPYKDRATPLQAGSICTIEPGIYLPGWGGVRLENMALIHPNHAEILNTVGFYEW